MAYQSKFTGAEVDSLLEKIAADDVGRIDSALSTTSTNPVTNKTITEELNKKATKTEVTEGLNTKADKTEVDVVNTKLTELSAEVDTKAEYIIISNNLFNPNDIMPNTILGSWKVGEIIQFESNASLAVAKISVEVGETYTFGGNGDIRTYCLGDAEGRYTRNNEFVNQNQAHTITIGEGTSFLWISVYMNKLDVAQVNKGTIKLPFDKFAVTPSLDGMDMLETMRKETAKAKYLESNAYSFEIGSISGSGELNEARTRARCRIPLVDNIENNIRVVMPSDYYIVAVFKESQAGKISQVSNTFIDAVVKKSNDCVALWIIIGLTKGWKIPSFNLPNSHAYNEYIAYIDTLDDKLKEDANNIEQHLSSIDIERKQDTLSTYDAQSDFKMTIDTIEKSIAPLYAIGEGKDRQTISLPHSNGGLYILNVHRRERDGYALRNNAYLPNARKDFSDVCVMGDNMPLGMHKIYSGNIDILPDDSLKAVKDSLIFADSHGNLYGGTKVSTNGKTWETIAAFASIDGKVCCIDSADNIFLSAEGKLYKSMPPYTSASMVLDTTQYHADSIVLSQCMVEHPTTGRLFVSTYQLGYDIHILYSDNNGDTWNTLFRTDKYQHIHRLYVDKNSAPIAIYAGCDGGGGVYKSTDNGNSWTDLREQNPYMPQSTDYGIIYSDPSGYRLSGGETSIVGGDSILKTTNDVNFVPKLSIGKGVYFVEKLGARLFASAIASKKYRTTSVLMSEDDGETWQTIHTTAPLLESGASDGYRYMSKVLIGDEIQLICGIQTQGELPPIRIVNGGDNYYAQFLIDVPEGVSEIAVESGHMISKIRPITNTYGYAENHLYGEKLTHGSVAGGRKLSDIYPYIQHYADRQSCALELGQYKEVNGIDLSKGNFHIGFWLKTSVTSSDGKRRAWYIVAPKVADSDYVDTGIRIESDFALMLGTQQLNSDLYPGYWGGDWIRIDINVIGQNKARVYVNGISSELLNISGEPFKYLTKDNIVCMYAPLDINGIPNDIEVALQYFEITEGNISDAEALRYYHANIFDL